MDEKIKVLILEDLPSDAELAEREVKAVLNNYSVVITDTEQGFIKALENFKPDLIISDYMLPTFDGMKALKITRKKEEFIPFIILTGSMNEETAVECMKAGADDYVIKEHIKRLGPSIINALDKKKIRQERKLTEEALKESELKFQKIINESFSGISVSNEEGKIIVWNNALEKITGIKKTQTIDRYIWDIQSDLIDHEETNTKRKEELKTRLLDILKTGKSPWLNIAMERNYVHPDGKVKIVSGSMYTIKTQKGYIVVSVSKDITESKLAEEKLKESEELFSKAFRSSPIAITITDQKTGKYVQVNRAWSHIYEYTEEETIGKTAVELQIVDENTRLQIIEELKQKVNLQNVEMQLRNKSGNYKWILYSTESIILGGEPCVLSTGIDITDRKQAEEAFKEAHSNLQALLDNRIDSIWSLDRDYNFIVFNKPYADVIYSNMGIRLKKGMNALEIHPKEVNDFWKPKFDEVFKGEHVTFEFSHVLDGKEHFFEVFMNPIYTDNKVSGLSALSMDITNRKLAEKELTKLSTAVTQSPSVIAITDTDGKLEYVNPKFTEITGYNMEEVIGQNLRILKSGEHSDEMYKELWETISSGKTWQGEFHNKKKNGELYWESASILPIFDENGKIINYLKDSENITEQKRNEQIQTIIHNISNAVITSHNPGNFLTFVKEELSKIIDTTNFFVALYDEKTDSISLPFHNDEKDTLKSFPAGKTLTNYVIKTGKTLLARKNKIEKLIKSGEIEQLGHPSKVWLGVPLKSNNKITGIFAVQSYENENAFDEADVKMLEIISDQISLSLERLKAEEDLKLALEKAQESEYKVRSMFENTQIGILYCNAEGKILEANQMLLDILGSPSMDATSKINLLTFKPLQENGFAQNVEKCISEKIIISEDTVYKSKWGKSIFMKYYLVPVILNNKVIGVWANLNNLTDLWNTQKQLKKAKEKAEESDRLKSAFLTNMSHEIRTPMNGILGFTELLKEPQLTGDEKDQYIRIIEKSGMRMLNTINDIIDISRIESGQVKVVNSEVSVNEILVEQYNFFQIEAKSKGLELIYKPSLPDNELRIITDQYKLEGILINLIKNAIKFTEKGSITFGYTIKTLDEKDVIEFYVKDTGIGIPADRIDAIFNRFEQADIEDTRAFQGSGLGLAISKSYVEMLGGKISVKSKEGEGSTFTFSIPYNKKSYIEISSMKKNEEESNISINNLSVIVAEDDETSRMFLESILENHFKRITYTTNGKETIENFQKNPDTDIILMDIKMPDMNGYDVTREIRKFNNNVIIIAQTAYGLAGDKEKAIEAGCDDYIAKPIKKEKLFEKITACVNKKSI